MSNGIFANKMEISCKAGAGKTVCASPDVCFTPPLSPATPPGVPVPYPNTGMASDCTEGSTTVKIGGQEVMLKNKSFFKTSTGDEAGNAPKKGVITSQIKGKCYFNSWSMDVLIEGENVDRHLDLTTHNHASQPGQTPPMPETEGMAVPPPVDCGPALKATPVRSHTDQQALCRKKSAAAGVKFESHHVIQNSHFQFPRGTTLAAICPGYSEAAAPCIALQDSTNPKTPHGRVSQMQKADAKAYRADYADKGKSPTYASARADSKRQLMAKKPGPNLSEPDAECVMQEVDRQFEDMCKSGMSAPESFKLRPPGQRGAGLPVKKLVKRGVQL